MSQSLTVLIILFCISLNSLADEPEHPKEQKQRQYTFAWSFEPEGELRPRGGTTSGPGVVLDTTPSPAWQALRADNLSKLEQDRRAILAMAGAYRASFDFIETAGFVPDYTPTRPYQSWGTEYVYIVEDNPEFISLQHIIVMFFKTEAGISQPMVVKHWRQDWQYQDTSIHRYTGHQRWQEQTFSAADVKGKWSQSVFQVDDSPRYESQGHWVHKSNYSSWLSEETYRPLPRREFSVRGDYQVLVGTNRHTITPTGWVHEQENLKVQLDRTGDYVDKNAVLAKEIGLNRYDRIEGFDFTAGDVYWARTAPFWADVRAAWTEIAKTNKTFKVYKQIDKQRLYAAMFGYADGIEGDYEPAAGKVYIEGVLDRFVE